MATPRGWNTQDDEDLLHLADAGFTLDSVAWALNRSRGTIRARLMELRWAPGAPVADRTRALPEPPRGESRPAAQVGPRKYLGF